MSQQIRPALFKSIKTLNNINLEKEFGIPEFLIRYEYEVWNNIVDCYIYGNEDHDYLIELHLGSSDQELKEAIKENDSDEEAYEDLFKAIQYCKENNIEWLQMVVL